MIPVELERVAVPRLNKIFWGGLLISVALHLVAALWIYIKAPELWQSITSERASPLAVKLNNSFQTRSSEKVPRPEQLPTPVDQAEPSEDSAEAEPVEAERTEPLPNEVVTEPLPVIEMAEPAAPKKTAPQAEAIDMSASSFSLGKQDVPASQERNISADNANQGSFSGVFDPSLRRKLQASALHQTHAEPDSFEVMNNKQVGDGSERVSFGDACFEITDAIGGGTDEKQVFRTNCLGDRDLSDRMMENVNRRIKERDER